MSTAKGLLNVHPRDMFFSRGFREASATNIKLEWAFCHISSVKCPRPNDFRCFGLRSHLLALALIRILTGNNGNWLVSQGYVISVTP